MLPPTARIRVITYIIIFELHFLQHIIYYSINHIIFWNISLRCICTIYIGLYQTDNTIVTSSIDKEIINGGSLIWKIQVVIFSGSGYTAPHFSKISLNIFRLLTNLYPFLGQKGSGQDLLTYFTITIAPDVHRIIS